MEMLLFPRQDVSAAAPADAQTDPCSITLSDPVPGLDSVSLTVATPGHNCSFTLTSLDAGGDGTECTRRKGGEGETGVEDGGSEEGGEVFTCRLDQLEPGTSHQLQIESQTDGEAANITLQTSESSQTSLFVRVNRVSV